MENTVAEVVSGRKSLFSRRVRGQVEPWTLHPEVQYCQALSLLRPTPPLRGGPKGCEREGGWGLLAAAYAPGRAMPTERL